MAIKTLTNSCCKVPSFQGKLLSDGGGENLASFVQRVIFSRWIKHYIAKKDIKFSNSMVEAVFRTFKQRYYLGRVKTYKLLHKKIYRSVHQYNEIVPHYALEGLTPLEKFEGDVCILSVKEELKQRNLINLEKRTNSYNSCKKCLDYLS